MKDDLEVPVGYILGAAIANLIRRVDALERLMAESPLVAAFNSINVQRDEPAVGATGTRRVVTKAIQEEMLFLHKRGLNKREIGKIMKFSPQTVANQLRHVGVPVKKQKEKPK